MGQFALVLFGALGLARDLSHAEEVAIGIFQHDNVIIQFITLYTSRDSESPDLGLPPHLALLLFV